MAAPICLPKVFLRMKDIPNLKDVQKAKSQEESGFEGNILLEVVGNESMKPTRVGNHIVTSYLQS